MQHNYSLHNIANARHIAERNGGKRAEGKYPPGTGTHEAYLISFLDALPEPFPEYCLTELHNFKEIWNDARVVTSDPDIRLYEDLFTETRAVVDKALQIAFYRGRESGRREPVDDAEFQLSRASELRRGDWVMLYANGLTARHDYPLVKATERLDGRWYLEFEHGQAVNVESDAMIYRKPAPVERPDPGKHKFIRDKETGVFFQVTPDGYYINDVGAIYPPSDFTDWTPVMMVDDIDLPF